MLLGGDGSRASEAEVDNDDGSPRAERVVADEGLPDTLETATDPTTPAALPIPMNGTIFTTSSSRHRTCSTINQSLRRSISCALILIPLPVPRASHCTTTAVPQVNLRSVLGPRPRCALLLITL